MPRVLSFEDGEETKEDDQQADYITNNANQGQIHLRELRPKGYSTAGINNGGILQCQGMLREIPSRAEDSEFYASDSSEENQMKRYESNDNEPEKKLRKLKEKTDDPGSGSMSIKEMKKLT